MSGTGCTNAVLTTVRGHFVVLATRADAARAETEGLAGS